MDFLNLIIDSCAVKIGHMVVSFEYCVEDIINWYIFIDTLPMYTFGLINVLELCKASRRLIRNINYYWGDMRQEHTNKVEIQSVQDGYETGHGV